MIPSPQTPSVATINLTGEAGVVDLPNSKGWAIAPDGAPSPVASGALRSPAFGRLSTIAGHALTLAIFLACLAIPAIFAGA